MDGQVFTIVGVAPPGFAFPVGSELWVPLAFTPAQAADRENRPLTIAGKLAAGRTLATAQAEMELVGRALSEAYPAANADPLAVYVPFRQAPSGGLLYAAIRTHGDPRAITPSVRQAVLRVDRFLPISNVRTMREAIADSSAGLSHLATLMGICGVIGLALSIVGIYSVMSYVVSQRTHEFGVRMALGATASDVFRMTLTEAGIVTGLGLAIGFALAFVLARLLSSALFGLISLHALIFLGAGIGLAIVSLGAACLPARRALTLYPAAILVASSL